MAETEYYLESDKIYVFPCANRGIVDAGKFTTEFNLRMLAKALSINTVTLSTTGLQAQCFVDGYYIALDLAQLVTSNLDALKGQQIYLKLNIAKPASTPTPTWMQQHSSVQHQYRLMSFDNANTKILDQDGEFKGAKITITNSEGAIGLGKVNSDGNAWEAASEPSPEAILNMDFPLEN